MEKNAQTQSTTQTDRQTDSDTVDDKTHDFNSQQHKITDLFHSSPAIHLRTCCRSSLFKVQAKGAGCQETLQQECVLQERSTAAKERKEEPNGESEQNY